VLARLSLRRAMRGHEKGKDAGEQKSVLANRPAGA